MIKNLFVNIKNFIFKIVPKYAVVPLLLCLVANLVAYYGSTIVVDGFGLQRYSAAIPLDYAIPFIPGWIIVYFGCYISWAAFYIIACRESKKACFDFVTAEVIAKMIALVVFIVFPTEMVERGDFEQTLGNGLLDKITAFMFNCDRPINLFPSIHCLASWIGFRGVAMCKKVPLWVKWFAFVLAILVFLSTLFVKQHYIIDIFGGILAVEIGMFISKKLKLGDFIRRKVYHEQ
ncbi:MAG: phosphatase PAP2 family protein [Acutalibacteraceae bacterium]|nr:phosphatase PAP2 family protein [Acutalibacteraceae bacterium]